MLIASQNGVVDSEEMMREYDTAEKIESKASGRSFDHMPKTMTKRLNARQYFAALQIAQQTNGVAPTSGVAPSAAYLTAPPLQPHVAEVPPLIDMAMTASAKREESII